MTLAIIPLIVLVVGLIMWFASTNGNVKEVGRIAFFCGLFVVLFALSGEHGIAQLGLGR